MATIRTTRHDEGRAPVGLWGWWLAPLAVVAAVVLLAAGCSDSDSSAEATTTTTVGEDPGGLAGSGGEDPDGEFIELDYWETSTGEVDSGERPECESPEEGVLACPYVEARGEIVTTLFGRATWVQTGVNTNYLLMPCDHPGGTDGIIQIHDGEATITTVWGDEVYYRVQSERCLVDGGVLDTPFFWVVDGGTGRFEDASGVMSGIVTEDAGSYSTGTLTVRAELWEEMLPPAEGE
jgi:hypothetical protein